MGSVAARHENVRQRSHLSYGAFRSVRDPDEFYIHTHWKDMAAFEHHAELPHTVRFVDAVEPLLDHPFKVTLSEQLW